MKKKIVTVLVGLATLFALVIGCAPREGIDYSQWAYPDTVKNISTICPFATPTTYPGHDPTEQLATDFMLPDQGTTEASVNCGNAIANWAINLAHLTESNWRGIDWKVHYVVWQQRIWQTEQQFWKSMEDRGSRTANHQDHVHVSYYA